MNFNDKYTYFIKINEIILTSKIDFKVETPISKMIENNISKTSVFSKY